MNKQFSNVLFGVLLIMVGALMILDKMNIFIFGWYEFYPLALVAISILNFINFSRGNKNAVFWGTACGILGVFFVMRNFELIDAFWYFDSWPIILLAFGIAFIVLYLVNPKDWGVLIPGVFLTFFAAVFLLDEFNIDFDLFGVVADFWPLALILIGGGLVIKSLTEKSQQISD